MKSNRSDYFIAAGVIGCSAVILVALTIALSGWKPSRKARIIYIDFPDVTGIRLHSAVRYAGAPAGKVSGFRLLSDEERQATNWSAVRVTIEIADNVPPLPDDVRASLSSDTMLSEKFIALSAGSPDHPKLADGAVLFGAGAAGLETLIDSVGPLVQSVDRLIAQVSKTLTGFDTVVAKTGNAVETLDTGLADALPRISKLADGLKITADSATATLERIDKVVTDADPLIKEDLRKFSDAVDELNKTLDSVGALVKGANTQISGRMQELSVVLQNLKVVSTHAKTLSKTLAESPHRLIFGGKPAKLPSEQEILRSSKPVPTR
jgi:ABC-type transporter Mla subunit MlaD